MGEIKVISEADVESLVMSSNDFIPSVIKAASALVARDKTISIVEYLTLFAVCEKIKKLVDNPLVVYVIALKSADGSVSFEESLRNIRKNLQTADNHTALFCKELLLTVGRLQDHCKHLEEQIELAFSTQNTVSGNAKSIVSAFSRTIAKVKEGRGAGASGSVSGFVRKYHLGNEFKDDNLPAHVVEDLVRSFEREVQTFKSYTDVDAPSVLLMETFDSLVEEYSRNAFERFDLLLRQIIDCRSRMHEDFKELVENIVIEAEHDMTEEMLRMNDMTRKDLWEKFGKEHASLIADRRYSRFKHKYDRQLDKIRNELMSIRGYIETSSEKLSENITKRDFLSVAPSCSLFFHIKNDIDNVTSNIIGLATFGGISAVVAAKYGILSTLAVTQVLTAPVGMGILGVIGVALAYKMITQPDTRVNMELASISKKLESNLTTFLDPRIKELDTLFQNEEKKLGDLYKDMFTKVIVNYRLVSLYRKLNHRVVNTTYSNALSDIAAIRALG